MRTFLAIIVLRLGIVFTLLYAAVAGILAPQNWIGYFPEFLRNGSFLPAKSLLLIFGIFEVILALLILFKRNVAWPSLLVSLLFLTIAFVNIAVFDAVFRDVGLAMAALALFFMGKMRI